jgi:hypothetical protein
MAGGGANLAWSLPAGAPVWRHGLCGLAQPRLEPAQHTPRFLFHEATLVLVVAGRLQLEDGSRSSAVVAESPTSLLLVQPATCAELVKTPGGAEQRFRSVLLTLSADLPEAFHRIRPPAEVEAAAAPASGRCRGTVTSPRACGMWWTARPMCASATSACATA